MSSPKGFATQKKVLSSITGFTQEQYEGKSDFATVKKIGSDSVAMEVLAKFAYDLTGVDDAAEAGSTNRLLKATAHGGRKGDMVRFLSGSNNRMEFSILYADANNIILDGEIDNAIGAGDLFRIFRYLTQVVDQNGAQSVVISGSALEVTQLLVLAELQAINTNQYLPARNKSNLDFSSTNVDNTAYVQVLASVGASAIRKIQVFMSSGEPLYLAFGGAGSEVDQIILIPGGNGYIDLEIAAATRISVKAVNVVTVNSGNLMINYFG